MAEELDDKVRELLEARRGHWRAIADETKLSYSWLSQFARRRIPNPGYRTLRTLQKHLEAPQPAAPAPAP